MEAKLYEKFTDDVEQLRLHPHNQEWATFAPCAQGAAERAKWKKQLKTGYDIEEWPERDVQHESTRCLKCADPPCAHSCPCHLDIKSMHYAASKGNYYYGGKVAYNDNPLALVCGYLCAGSELCAGGCNLNASHDGAVDIPSLQRFVCTQFQRLKVKPIRDPHLKPLAELPDTYKKPIGIVGSGPASLSCAAFLSRLGYQQIKIYEQAKFAGGILASEIPEFRIPYAALTQDIDYILSQGGIEIEYGKKVGGTDAELAKLRADVSALFLGTGLTDPIILPFLQDACNQADNIETSRTFLTRYAHATKPLEENVEHPKPKVAGHVVVLGGGDVAFNSAAAALECGASRVTLVFRENFPKIPSTWEELHVALKDGRLDFVSNAVPAGFSVEGGKVKTVKCNMANWEAEHAVYAEKPTAQVEITGAHFIIAFGARSGTPPAPLSLSPRGILLTDPDTMQVIAGEGKVCGVWAGGDIVGSHTVVEAVNDGKTAAWSIHCAIQGLKEEEANTPKLPMLYTEADEADLSVDVCGIHFVNPFGLSSATPVTSIGMIKRAFALGYGFAVTKTAVPDKDLPVNVGPRIVHSRDANLNGGWINIENVTEKSMSYWVEGTKHLKKEYPDRIVIFSIMAQYNKDDWAALAREAEASGADALELNVSCPHVGRKGMGSAAGQNPDAVRDISGWVKSAVKIPVFTKLTPNITDIAAAAASAIEGGADGVSAINTVSGVMHISRDGTMKPCVGAERKTAYGGVSGGIIRPIGLRAVTSIRGQKSTANTAILGIGGIDSADTAIQYILGGSNVVQMTTSIQQQDYSIVREMIEGTKFHLYMEGRKDLKSLQSQYVAEPVNRDDAEEVVIPKLETQTGKAVNSIVLLPQLDAKAQVIALVNDDECFKCGRCYMSCNDTGYQAIKFDADTHLPTILPDKCMGCGLCGAVCPARCITYGPKQVEHVVDRCFIKDL